MNRLRNIVLAASCLVSAMAAAHDARPLSIAIAEQADGVYRATVRIPPSIDTTNLPLIIWPSACEQRETAPLGENASISLIACPGGLEERTIRIEYPLYNPSITSLVRLQTVAGLTLSAVLPPDVAEWTVPEKPTFLNVAVNYLRLGFTHIWEGPDHLLFVAGLLLLARSMRRIVLAVTGFTAAHSITLSLAALGLVRPAIEPVEAMIALSILFLAAEIARGNSRSLSSRFPIVLSFVFGLLHGFGFAGALGEIGLPQTELAAGLAFFNIGVELGQLAFIAAAALILLLAGLLRKLSMPKQQSTGGQTAVFAVTSRTALIGAYCLGIPAAFWSLERTLAAFAL